MTNEERDIITQFLTRISGARPQAQTGLSTGSVPATVQPPLPPVDRDADALIGALFQQYPDARYRLTQTAFVQEHALAEAQNRIQRLEWELQQSQQAAQAAQQRPSGGIFGGLFGGRAQAPPPPQQPAPAWNAGPAPQPGYQQAPPQPQYAPGYQPGMFQQRAGGGFLSSALTTAAGVGGGILAAQAITGLLSGHQGGMMGGGFGGGGFGGGMGGGSPWAGTTQSDYGQQDSNWAGGGPGNQGAVDNGTWDQPAPEQSSWTDNSGGGSWDSSGDSSGDSGGGGGGGGGSDDTF
jgi:hypothetical protein